ncbi:LacI family DNA-binding transcriptional regulator [Alloiococcus sp. CFN-8]|uniref:LacI family DNA-binding transcriptional regulator n=1 Tax=Alloiococcus sp. CFN-8 TaxID=3416081 RepID=UPI003CF8F20B
MLASSIRDVARKAGVSVSTVSRAFNEYSDIKDDTKNRIFEVAKELGYVPNISARNLSKKNKLNIAMIVSGFMQESDVDEFQFLLMKGAYGYAMDNSIEIATYAIDSNYQKEKTYDQFCLEHSLSGALLLGLKTSDEYLKSLKDVQFPCVTVDVELEGDKLGNVLMEDQKAFQEITEYVLQNNHRKLVLVYGKKEALVSRERYMGFSKAIEEAGLSLETMEIIYGEFSEADAYKEARKLIEEKGKEFTAFVAMSDLMAIGVMRAIKDCGYKVPEDFSVTGFDGVNMAAYVEPAITTINQKVKKRGYAAVDLLMNIINGKATAHKIVTEYELVIRDSVKKI